MVTSLRKQIVACVALALAGMLGVSGCAAPTTRPTSQPASQPGRYDTTAAKPVPPRDWFERMAEQRGVDWQMVDSLVDKQAPLPPFKRQPLGSQPSDARISGELSVLDDTEPFAMTPPLATKEATITAGIARSTFRTREPAEVMAAVQPFLDLTQRDVNVRADIALHERPEEIFRGLRDGREQLVISHVFDYLLVRAWLEDVPNAGAIPLDTALPAHPRVMPQEGAAAGIPGTSIELIVLSDSRFQSPGDLRGARLAMTADYVHAPGAFLTRVLMDLGHPLTTPYFSQLKLRRYAKDAVVDVLKGKADAACVDQGTLGAIERFYGLGGRFRAVAVSPRYNIDVLYSSENNLAAHRTEIELTQRQLTTLPKNPEGQEVLFLFDIAEWRNYVAEDWAPAREHFGDFLKFWEETPVDLKPLLDPRAPVDRQTYDRFGDE